MKGFGLFEVGDVPLPLHPGAFPSQHHWHTAPPRHPFAEYVYLWFGSAAAAAAAAAGRRTASSRGTVPATAAAAHARAAADAECGRFLDGLDRLHHRSVPPGSFLPARPFQLISK